MTKEKEKNPDLCMTCDVYGDCPILDWEWTEDIKRLYSESPLPREPKVTISITSCNEYRQRILA